MTAGAVSALLARNRTFETRESDTRMLQPLWYTFVTNPGNVSQRSKGQPFHTRKMQSQACA
jgi:hypothetical protein